MADDIQTVTSQRTKEENPPSDDSWMFLFHENLLLTVQSIYQVQAAFAEKFLS